MAIKEWHELFWNNSLKLCTIHFFFFFFFCGLFMEFARVFFFFFTLLLQENLFKWPWLLCNSDGVVLHQYDLKWLAAFLFYRLFVWRLRATGVDNFKKKRMPAIFITKVMLPTSSILCGLLWESKKKKRGQCWLNTTWAYSLWWVQFLHPNIPRVFDFFSFTCVAKKQNKKNHHELVFFMVKFQPYPTRGAGTRLHFNMFSILSSLAHIICPNFQMAAWMNQRFQRQAKHFFFLHFRLK